MPWAELLSCVKRGKIGANDSGGGVLLPERLFADRQGLLEVRACRDQVALSAEQIAEIVQARGGVGVALTQHLAADRQRLLVAATRSPWAWRRAPRLFRLCAVSG
jgi:hypothetical protein